MIVDHPALVGALSEPHLDARVPGNNALIFPAFCWNMHLLTEFSQLADTPISGLSNMRASASTMAVIRAHI